MKLEFEVARSELSAIADAVNRAVWKLPEHRTKRLLLQAINIILWIPVGYFVAQNYDRYGPQFGKLIAIGILLGFGVKWIYEVGVRLVLKSLPQELGPTLGAQNFVAGVAGVSICSAHHKSSTEWAGIRAIALSGNYILVFIDSHLAYYIPTRALPPGLSPQFAIEELNKLRSERAT